MDFTLKSASSMLVCGPTQSGKSTFVHNLLANKNIMFDTEPSKIYWFHGQFSNDLIGKPYVITQGLPESFDDVEPNSVIVFDDLMNEAKDHAGVSALFTKHVHHHNLFVINITQNLFLSSKETRTRRINTQYIVMFKNPADQVQILTLSRQMYPTDYKFLSQVYINVTKRAHGYIFIDLRQETPEEVRIRTNVLPHEQPLIIFLHKHIPLMQS